MKNNPPLILVVDDEEDMLVITRTKLESAGFKIATLSKGSSLLLVAKQIHPDLIILDINMPEIKGTEALLDLKNDPELKDTKVVFFTNVPQPWPAVKGSNDDFAKELGAAGFLRKDTDLDVLAAKITEIIASK